MLDSTLTIAEEAHDRLQLLARDRGTSVRDLVERLAAHLPTEAERAERTARAPAHVRANLCPVLSADDVRRAQQWRADIAAGRLGSRR